MEPSQLRPKRYVLHKSEGRDSPLGLFLPLRTLERPPFASLSLSEQANSESFIARSTGSQMWKPDGAAGGRLLIFGFFRRTAPDAAARTGVRGLFGILGAKRESVGIARR